MIKEIFVAIAEGATKMDDIKQKIPGSDVDTGNVLKAGLSWTFAVVGILAIVMIIVSGIQMTTSAGDAGVIAKAKKTMTYSIVGLVIAILAYAIVHFVVGRV